MHTVKSMMKKAIFRLFRMHIHGPILLTKYSAQFYAVLVLSNLFNLYLAVQKVSTNQSVQSHIA